jgi:aminotransferase
MKPPEHVLEAIHKGFQERAFDVQPSEKVGKLHGELGERAKHLYGIEVNPKSEITITVGASFVIDAALRILVDPNDEVLLIDPDYTTYESQASGYSKNVINIPSLKEDSPGEWRFDIDEFQEKASPKAKLLMISNSNNPTGYVYSEKDNKAILEIAEDNDFYILSDQVSEEIVFSDGDYHSIISLPNAIDRTIVCSSFSKLYNLSGLRIGIALADKKIIEQINLLTGWVTDGICAPGVDAALALLSKENRKKTEEYVKKVLSDLEKRRDYMEQRLSDMNGVYPNHPTALYWAFPNVESFGVTSQKLSEFLMKEEKVYVRPGTWYGRNGEGHFRLSFCVSWDWIRDGMDKMERGLQKFPK